MYTLGTFLEKNEGLTRNIDISLNSLAGKNVQFILRAYNYRYPAGDGESAIWGDPVIRGTGGSVPPSTSGWNTYRNTPSNFFQFKFPSPSAVNSPSGKITLPKNTQGTNMLEKNLEVSVTSPSTPGSCKSSKAGVTKTDTPTINGMVFTREEGNYPDPLVSSNLDEWVAYSIEHNYSGTYACISISLTMISDPAGSLAYSMAAESAVLETIISTLEIK